MELSWLKDGRISWNKMVNILFTKVNAENNDLIKNSGH